MKQAVIGTLWIVCGWSQSNDAAPKFLAADVHPSAKSTTAFSRVSPVRGGRYEIKQASMVDLIRIAYGFDNDKIVGGPSWLEMNRYDVAGKVPPDSKADEHKQMLQALLAERFKLVAHKDTRPLPAYALVAGKKPQLKEADGTGDMGCKPESGSGAPAEGTTRLFMMSANGTQSTFVLGPGATIHYQCRNMTMAEFASGLRGMMGADLGGRAVSDETDLKGRWNFDVRWSMQFMGPMGGTGDRIPLAEALEKQLGLKLEERQIPTPVMVVESVNEQPSPNPPGTAEALPPIAPPTEFEVASVKPSDPGGRGGRFMNQPGGRFVSEGMNLRFLIGRAFNTNNRDAIVGLPPWADTERFDITAKAPSADATAPPLDPETNAVLLRALLVDRFKMKYHNEDQPATAYTLVAAKPKLKKADPTSRTYCKNPNSAPGVPPGTRIIQCQNVTMAQFAERLQNLGPELSWPVADGTELEGGWDLTLSFSPNFQMAMPAGRGGDRPMESGPPGAAVPMASDPTGRLTIFEAIEKELGLKLVSQKRTMPVIVIDHIEQKPTEN
jgi:uncharacterized protein (TIGR03435 family)